MIRETVKKSKTGHGREKAVVVGVAVAAVIAAVGSTRRPTAVAAAPVVVLHAQRSFRDKPAVAAPVKVVEVARGCHSTPAFAVVAVVGAVYSCSKTPAAAAIATSLAAAPAVFRRRNFRSRRSRRSLCRRCGHYTS